MLGRNQAQNHHGFPYRIHYFGNQIICSWGVPLEHSPAGRINPPVMNNPPPRARIPRLMVQHTCIVTRAAYRLLYMLLTRINDKGGVINHSCTRIGCELINPPLPRFAFSMFLKGAHRKFIPRGGLFILTEVVHRRFLFFITSGG